MAARISALSKEYVRVQVEAKEAGVLVNPTTLVVKMAFVPDSARQPVSSDWQTASWETEPGPLYFARIVVGPGGFVLAPATYTVWVQITDTPEIPARPAGPLVVF